MVLVLPKPRAANAVLTAAAAALLAYAYYLQLVVGLQPCNLCILQRVALIAVLLALAGAAAHGAKGWGRGVWALLVGVASAVGAGIAGWHVRMQNLPPDQIPGCGPGIDYLLEVMPAVEALQEVFTASGECAKVDWTLFGLAMPVWTLLAFLGFATAGVWNNLRR
jgi:disulfide bond formation protein DsbB